MSASHAAADALALTQSAVSERVQALERRLGLVLVGRGQFGVGRLKPAKALDAPAERALHELAEAERAVFATGQNRPGSLTAPSLVAARGR